MIARATVVLGIGLLSGACRHEPAGATSDDAGSRTSEAVTLEQAAQVLARIGSTTITVGDFVEVLRHLDQFDRLRFQSAERRKELLNEMINVQLLADEASAHGYDTDPLAQQERRAVLRDAMLAHVRETAPTPAGIPEGEVRAYYQEHIADYRDPERRRLSVIVLADEPSAKKVLESALKTASAAEWGELVRKHSTDAAAKTNVPVDLAGDVGFVTPPGDQHTLNPRVPDAVRNAAYKISKVGAVLDHVVSAAGAFYVVRLVQIAEARERTFPEAERAVRVKLAQAQTDAREQAVIAQLRAKVPVQLDESVLAQVSPTKAELPPPSASTAR